MKRRSAKKKANEHKGVYFVNMNIHVIPFQCY